MSKSDSRFEYKASLKRTDFDLGQKLGFTSASGMLLPIWFDFASPGDSYYMQHDLPLLRSAVLASPAMVDVKVHFETFFVPMQMVYQPFEQTMFYLKEAQSSNYNLSQLLGDNFPLFDYGAYITDILTNYHLMDNRTDAFRLADLFGLNAMDFTKSVASPSTDPRTLNNLFKFSPSFFPWQILAYNTIYQYYYRLDDKSQFENYFTNFDKYYNSSTPVSMTADFMRVHQRPWDFDYFTSMYRSPIVSDANLQSILPSGDYSLLLTNGKNTSPIDYSGASTLSNIDKVGFSSVLSSIYSSNFVQAGISTAMIRQMFANERLAMIIGRTKKNYDSQVLAHYGVQVPHDVKHDLTMIHHDMYELNVQEVTNLAASSTSPLGELAGKSYAYGNGKQFKFTAPCHGVMMTIFSVEPRKRYFGGFDKINEVVHAFDFPTPEFDRLGNEPMYRFETGMLPSTSGYTMADIIGWKEHYYQNKRKYDKTTYAFGHGVVSGSVNNYSTYMLAFRPFAPYEPIASGSASTAARPDLENRFYIERNAMDALCTVGFVYGWIEGEDGSGLPSGENWSVTPWLVYARDPFIVNSNIKCKKVSWMSKDGEPIYNY